MDRREIITGAFASVGAAVAGTAKKKIERIKTEDGSHRFFEEGEEIHAAVHDENFIEHWIIPHGGDCCGCIVSETLPNNQYILKCNECGERVDVMVSEIAFKRMAEALQRAHHALAFASGHVAHDGMPEHAYTLDFSKELAFIDETLKHAKVEPRVLEPLA